MKKQAFGMVAALFALLVMLPAWAYAADSAYAILYEDGTLVFQNAAAPEPGRPVKATYEVDLTGGYVWPEAAEGPDTPWIMESYSIFAVSFADKISPASTAYWFYRCGNLERVDNIENLDTANVTDMRYMFCGCEALQELDASGFDTAKVTNMNETFCGCSALKKLDVSGFDTANVTDMKGMFWCCGGLTALDVSHFDTANVTTMNFMFASCDKLAALDVSHFDTANVTDMHGMFYGCAGITRLDLSHFNTAKVTTMNDMFCFSGVAALDLSNFDTANVTDMFAMFDSCFKLTTICVSEKFTTASLTENGGEAQDMFSNSPSLVGGNGTRHSESHTDKEYARIDTPSTPGYFTYKAAPVSYKITAAATENGKLSATLSNPGAATVAAAYFDANGKFVSVRLQSVPADAGTVALELSAGAATARVMLLDGVFRPLCAAFAADVGGAA